MRVSLSDNNLDKRVFAAKLVDKPLFGMGIAILIIGNSVAQRSQAPKRRVAPTLEGFVFTTRLEA